MSPLPARTTHAGTKITKIAKITKSTTAFVFFAAFVAIVVNAVPAAAADVNDGTIVIRTYDAAGPARDRAVAVTVAGAILAAAGVAVTWVACDGVPVRAHEDPCVAPIGPATLAVRFVRVPARQETGARHGSTYIALGDSLVDTGLRTGALATIYLDRVSALAGAGGIDEATLLGRAIAHEVGHLLIGTADHAGAGLMRAAWTQEALRGGRQADWLFAPRDARAMRDAVRRRTARQLASARIGS